MHTANIEEVLNHVTNVPPTVVGGVEILTEVIKKHRFSLNLSVTGSIKKAKLIKYVDRGFLSFSELNGEELIDPDFLKQFTAHLNDINDFTYILKALNVPLDLKKNNLEHSKIASNDVKSNHNIVNNQRDNNVNRLVEFKNTVQKWRRIETNLASYLKSREGIDNVIDVSKSNFGYDLEVYKGSDREYIEVKSVDRIGMTISMTNNEYSTANQYKDKYILAIARQSEDGLEVCFIRNPLDNLDLTKRVTRWEWICDSYNGGMNFFNF